MFRQRKQKGLCLAAALMLLSALLAGTGALAEDLDYSWSGRYTIDRYMGGKQKVDFLDDEYISLCLSYGTSFAIGDWAFSPALNSADAKEADWTVIFELSLPDDITETAALVKELNSRLEEAGYVGARIREDPAIPGLRVLRSAHGNAANHAHPV